MSGSLKATVLADLTSGMNEVREKDETSSRDNELEEKFIPDASLVDDDIEIKEEEVDYGNSDCGSEDKVDEEDMNHIRSNILHCDKDCDTCITLMRRLSAHVKASHAPPPFVLIHDSTLNDLLHMDTDTTSAHQSSSIAIGIKSEPDETVEKMGCAEEEAETKGQQSDPESEAASVNDPDYTPPPSHRHHLTQHIHCQGLTKNNGSSDSKSYKTKKKKNPSFHKCDVCHKRFSTKYHLNTHKRTHTGEKPHKCTTCGNGLITAASLKVHMRIHTGEKPYKCTECEKNFTTTSQLNVHKRVHTGEKPFKCTLCPKSFSASSSLSDHIIVHTGEKPYGCDLCEKRFAKSHKLSLHKAKTHNGETVLKCDVCGKNFGNTSHLTLHKRGHIGEKPRPFKCDVCGKAFWKAALLTQHKRTHTGERPFTCEECGKSFKDNGTLTVHKRLHTGENPRKCTVCEESFRTVGQLSHHRKMKH